MQRYAACMESAGAQVTLVDQNGLYCYKVAGEDNVQAYEAAQQNCRAGNTRLIEPLYVDQFLNPTKSRFEDLVARCFVEKGVAPPEFTAEDFLAIVVDNPRGLSTANEPGSKWAGFNFDPDSNPDALACLDAS